MKSYKLRYLPIFSEDLCEAATYISEQLNNPHAAENLINEVEEAILKRLEMPLSFDPFKIEEMQERHLLPHLCWKLHYILRCD